MFFVFLLVGCSDYNLNQAAEKNPASVDSGPDIDTDIIEEPATCLAWQPPSPYPVTVQDHCLQEPMVGTFTPVIEWQWSANTIHSGYHQIMSTPAVANLNDDNGDGLIDENDIPDIVFTSFSGGAYSSPGTISAISGDDGTMLWSVMQPGGYAVFSSGGVAIGDLQNDGTPEVCTAGVDMAVVCLSGQDGSLLWAAGTEISVYGFPSIADLHGDGLAEVIYGRQVFSHDGQLLFHGGGGAGGSKFMAVSVDWDGDGDLDVVAGNTVYAADGTVLLEDGYGDGAPAIGDFNMDGKPDQVRTLSSSIALLDNSGSLVWQQALPGGGNGGAPTVADFDGDGLPEVGVADLSRYSVFDTDGSLMWSNVVSDYSSSQTGSSVFDFEGDGIAEVVYSDEHTLWVFDGRDGSVLMEQTGHASGTLMEYPLIADVDNDGSTEIIVASNNYTFLGWNGITVIGDANNSWAPARPIWNQYAYHITNVNNDGSIPAVQQNNWLSWNNFRAGGTELGPANWRADVHFGDVAICRLACEYDLVTFSVAVENSGLLPADGVEVMVLQSIGSEFASDVLTLASGESQFITPIEISRAAWGDGLFLLLDEANVIRECDEANNFLSLGDWPCD